MSFFVGKMKEGEFERIENLFKKGSLPETSLQSSYYVRDFSPIVIMVKENEMKIIAVMDVTRSNKEFYWAYSFIQSR